MINLNDVAKNITEAEGLKKSMSIAQVKEVLRIVFTQYSLEDIVRMYFKFNR